MRQIEFGFSNYQDPTGQWEGMGIKKGLLLPIADYYGSIQHEGNSYIVAKVTEDKYHRYPSLLGKFLVRPALVDSYADGSGVLYLDQEETEVSKLLQDELNDPRVKGKIKTIEDIQKIINKPSNRLIDFYEMQFGGRGSIISTSIPHETFEKKNELIKRCHMPISRLMERIINLELELDENQNYQR